MSKVSFYTASTRFGGALCRAACRLQLQPDPSVLLLALDSLTSRKAYACIPEVSVYKTACNCGIIAWQHYRHTNHDTQLMALSLQWCLCSLVQVTPDSAISQLEMDLEEEDDIGLDESALDPATSLGYDADNDVNVDEVVVEQQR